MTRTPDVQNDLDPVSFGNYRGKTLPQSVFTDPDWFFWAQEERHLDSRGLTDEAARVNERARRICNSSVGGVERVAVYTIHPSTKNVADLEFVPKSRVDVYVESGTKRRDVIDLPVPHETKNYDKTGSKIVLREAKDVLFPGVRRLTREILDAFFDDDDNFAI